MTENNLTPSSDLVHQWNEEVLLSVPDPSEWSDYIATQAARWGADQELEACCEWLVKGWFRCEHEAVQELRAARRPKPPSLVQRALHILGSHGDLSPKEHDTIRKALEKLND